MGQAKQRGTYEQRKAEGIVKRREVEEYRAKRRQEIEEMRQKALKRGGRRALFLAALLQTTLGQYDKEPTP